MDVARRREIRRVLRHDVRTPLAVILGRCELLAAELQGPMTAEQHTAVDAIRRNADRLAGLLDEAVALLDQTQAG
ncbi:MAG: signal transduction histidine kinase [Myxococcota bacterium]|jgi:signal transduction histidine kinase